MYDLDKTYTKRFFASRESLRWRVPIVTQAIMEVLQPQTIIDVGCGNGDLVWGFQNLLRAPIFGIEGSMHALDSMEPWMKNYIFIRDLRKPLNDLLLNRVSLAVCFEVAEHIEPQYSNVFVDNLCSLSDHILMSAAPPGQGGLAHVNCQPWSYWFYKFSLRNYRLNSTVVDELRAKWEPYKHKKGIKAYYNNLMYWEAIK
jgi:hypothetical protein